MENQNKMPENSTEIKDNLSWSNKNTNGKIAYIIGTVFTIAFVIIFFALIHHLLAMGNK